MKNVLLALDLSEYAQTIALHTAELAQRAEARLILFYAFTPASPTEDEASCPPNERCIQASLDNLAHRLHQQTRVSVTRLVKPGIPPAVIFEVANGVKADLVVICRNNCACTAAITVAPPLAVQINYKQVPVLTVATSADPLMIKAALAQHIHLPDCTASSRLDNL
ncbi:universal stress protein [Pontibacter sp. E15-1]|uniref:universal stress protein n=1 Tax=Pontibacter sp. E15-1 TaxID=2919918 RepID=UPI001F4F2A97|nr:universal stress protein [Pontibacter sp. E15-1]MCJ8163250.1 universal stress protein [Pontibacter sp. E15-1]